MAGEMILSISIIAITVIISIIASITSSISITISVVTFLEGSWRCLTVARWSTKRSEGYITRR